MTKKTHEFEPLAQAHARENPGHQVRVDYNKEDDLLHEVCKDCDWWNDQ